MQQTLFTIVYCSKNKIEGDPAAVSSELKSILASSRKNNGNLEITGALLYNAGSFAQVLEGPLAAIEGVFETIQRDRRHSQIVVVEHGPISKRQFPEWSMALAGNSSAEGKPATTAAFEAVFSRGPGAKEQMLALLEDLIVKDDDYAFLEPAA